MDNRLQELHHLYESIDGIGGDGANYGFVSFATDWKIAK
jgi:hypothetical protein